MKTKYSFRSSTTTKALLFFAFLFLASLLQAQDTEDAEAVVEENKIEGSINSMITSHPMQMGFLRFRPKLTLGSAYDSNVLNTQVFEVADNTFSVAPGGSFALKMGQHAYAVVDEDLNFVYYHDLEQLRDFFPLTSINFVTGTPQLLLETNATFVNMKSRITSELDFPTQQKIEKYEAALSYQLLEPTELTFHPSYIRSDFSPIEDVNIPTPVPSDYRTLLYEFEVEQHLIPELSVIGNGRVGNTLFPDEPGDNKRDQWRALVGLGMEFERISGRGMVGYGSTERKDAGDFEDFLYSGDFAIRFRSEVSLEISYSRQREVSALLENDFRINNLAAIGLTFPLGERVWLSPRFYYQNNDYGNAVYNGRPITEDVTKRPSVEVDFELPKSLWLGVDTGYSIRESNIEELSSSRFAIGFHLELKMNADSE